MYVSDKSSAGAGLREKRIEELWSSLTAAKSLGIDEDEILALVKKIYHKEENND